MTCQKGRPSTLMANVACKSKVSSAVGSLMHPFPGNLVATGHAVMYYACGAHAFSAGIECQHCSISKIDYNMVCTTVQTFNSCTSRPDICQCLVVQTPMDNMSKTGAKDINDPRSLQIKATFSCEDWTCGCIHA